MARRAWVLVAAFALCGALVLARLFEVQLLERRLWAGEARRLVQTARVIPYERGRILDARGAVLAHDQETWELALVYRDFRRGHPLGLVAHARSLLEGRPVSLSEAAARLGEWGRALAALTPREVEALDADAARELAHRASDVRFYLRSLLELAPGEWKRLLELAEGEPASFLALAARVRAASVETLGAELDRRLARALSDLDELAARIELAPRADDAPLPKRGTPRLLHELELARRWVEDATAAKLFVEAAGFPAGRLEPEVLRASFDLGWIADCLAWDGARLDEWARGARASWRAVWRDGWAIPSLAEALFLDPARERGPDDVLDALAALIGPEGLVERALDGDALPWRELETAAVLARLDDLVEGGVPEASVATPALSLFDAALRARPSAADSWILLDALFPVAAGESAWGPHVQQALGGRRRADVDDARRLVGQLADGLEARLQAELAARLGALAKDGALALARAGRERALERAEYFLKDYGSRPRLLQHGPPAYEVVHLLSRFEDRYPGIEARESRERVHPAIPDPSGAPALGRPAALLVGRTSSVGLTDVLRARRDERRVRELQERFWRDDDEELELKRLVGRVVLRDEQKGVSGVEGFFDAELTGRNGYRESRGLEEAFGALGDEDALRAAENGLDVELTLELALQRAAERALAHPAAPDDDPEYDRAWQVAPVGCIVALTPEGDVLCAASEPSEWSALDDDAVGQRALAIERSLRQPTFEPPGSVFKPFVALWALDRLGLDPRRTAVCGPIEKGGHGYVDLNCHSSAGHGAVDLRAAIAQSCNAYFAWLGEQLTDADFRALAPLFGFGERTGVRTPPPWDAGGRARIGLTEDLPVLFGRRELGDSDRRKAGNGLSVVQATPMQVARAYAALATGELPSLRIATHVGGTELPRAPARRLELDPEVLRLVRSGMAEVANSEIGTARRTLSREELGFEVAAKTGSADLVASRGSDGAQRRVRKHAWVAGWVGLEEPALVFLIFVHDTSSTSAHGAAYLSRQFLRSSEVRAWLVEHGVEVDGEGAGGAGAPGEERAVPGTPGARATDEPPARKSPAEEVR
jgi:cell division protein FtsI/penicillin-binding protein 2